MSLPKLTRTWHRWGAVLTALPVIVIFASGILLQLKKDWSWVQPPTERGVGDEPTLAWSRMLEVARATPQAEVSDWSDIERVDMRPERGVLKLRCVNRWELQLDSTTGELLGSSYRRSDLIESIHDGSWLHERAKLWVWLPTGIVLCGMWGTGIYLWILPHWFRRRRKVR